MDLLVAFLFGGTLGALAVTVFVALVPRSSVPQHSPPAQPDLPPDPTSTARPRSRLARPVGPPRSI